MMSKDIQLLGLTGICLLICGSVFIHLSGFMYPESLYQQSSDAVPDVENTIIVTHTRVPKDSFVGLWDCINSKIIPVMVEKNGNFYTVTFDENTQLLGTRNNEELLLEDGSAMRMNNNSTKLLINNPDGNGISCNRAR